MKLLKIAKFSAVFLLIAPAPALAAPSANYGPLVSTPYVLSKEGTAIINSNAIGSAAGGVATSFASATAVPKIGSIAAGGVLFDGPIDLSGSPGGWLVTLTANLNGNLTVSNSNNTGGFAFVRGGVNTAGLYFNFFDSTSGLPPTKPVNLSDKEVGIVSDGEYSLSGNLSTTAIVGTSDLNAPGNASSNFDGLTFSVSAVPVPEPSSIVGTGAIGVLLATSLLLKRKQLKTAQ